MRLTLCFLALFIGIITEMHSQPAFFLFNNNLKNVNDIEQKNSQILWLATDSGVVKVNVTTQNFNFYLPQPASGNQAFVRIKAVGNKIWAASAFHGLWKFNGFVWTNFNEQNGLASDTIYDFDISANGHLWIATGRGICEFDGNSFTTHNPFSYKKISAICTFGDTIYAGNRSSTEPIKKYSNGTWQSLPNTALAANGTTSLKVSADGKLHATTNNGSYTYNASGWQLSFYGGSNRLSKNGSFTKIINYDNIGTYFQGTWDTLKNPLQFFMANRVITSISSNSDSSFWCGYTAENTTVLAHYFIQEENNSFEKLTSNSLTAGFSSDGFFFQNSSDFDAVNSLTGQGKTIAFVASPKISAWQGSAQNRISVSREYMNEGLPAMVIGPVSTNRNSAAFFNKYNRVWRLTKAEIETHKNNFANSGYIAPAAILTWPGNGDVQYGEEKYVAPFIDQNYNGIYEPMLGDYPDIRGDEAVYFVYNSAQANPSFGHQNLNIEFHTMAYVFDSLGTSAHNALFINQKLIFKDQAFDTVLYGLFTDFDLGNFADDLTGCDSINNLYYVYNRDDVDEGPNGWGQKPPAAGLVPLNHLLKGFIDYNMPASTSPKELYHFRTLQRKWADGSPLRIDNPSGFNSALNGTGHLPNSNLPPTNWHFNDAVNWYYSLGLGLMDKRSTGIFEFTNIQAGDEICFDYAFLYAGDSNYVDATSSINKFKSYAIWLRDLYALKDFECANNSIGVTENNKEILSFLLYPNPNKGYFFVRSNASNSAKLVLINAFGQTLQTSILEANSTSKIQTSNLAAGMYMCLFLQNEQIIHSEKVIINK